MKPQQDVEKSNGTQLSNDSAKIRIHTIAPTGISVSDILKLMSVKLDVQLTS